MKPKKCFGRTPETIKAVRPLKDGVIADFEMVETLLSYLLKKINIKNKIVKPRIIICCPSNITEVENESGIDFSYEIVKRENGKVKILIKVQDRENGINKVEVPGDAIILNGTREQKGIDQEIGRASCRERV